MNINNIFGVIPSSIRYAEISDTAKLVWVEIYCYNFTGTFTITNKEIASDLKKDKITISRAVNELLKSNLIEVKGQREKRKMTVKQFLIQANVTEEVKTKVIYTTENAALKEFYKQMGLE